jgi:SAM-dependent methyltransferase
MADAGHGGGGAAAARTPPPPSPARERHLLGSALTLVTGAALAGAVVLVVPFFVVPWLPRRTYGALPWLPTSARRVHALLDRVPAGVRSPPGRRAAFIDLGSGDGEAVLVAARRGMAAVGVELNPSLVAISRLRAWGEGLEPSSRPRDGDHGGSASFSLGNLLDAPVGGYDVVFVFGVVPLMPRISAKLAAEAHPACWVAAYKFPLAGHGWEGALVGADDGVYLYDASRRQRGGDTNNNDGSKQQPLR